MNAKPEFRNYRLVGNADTKRFELADWYTTPIARKRMKQLMKRSDGPALRNYGLLLALLVSFALLGLATWGSWWAIPVFAIYGVLYASAAESRFHEALHGTPFKTRWLNEVFLQIFGFMALKNPYVWRWSHTRHHTDTIVVGRDPEIAFPRPPDLISMVANLLHLRNGYGELKRAVFHSLGALSADEKDYIPAQERAKVFLVARIHLAILAGAIIWSLSVSSIMPLMFVGLPTFYGSFVHHILAAMQHAGLAEDHPDHRVNSRTVYLNPVLRFIYANMNYHVEHHMFPMVPFHALPALHEEMKHDCPPAYDGVLPAYREMLPALLRQLKDPAYFVERQLPPGAGQWPGAT